MFTAEFGGFGSNGKVFLNDFDRLRIGPNFVVYGSIAGPSSVGVCL